MESQTTYLTTDSLGSPRVITDNNGNVISRRDFLPFGEEILANENDRKAALGYNTGDNLRQKFTGYEKDTETDLDFARNRYYSGKVGRFSTVDPLMASAEITDPQSFNRYSYVLNNPLNLIDPSGLMSDPPGGWYRPAEPGEDGLYHPEYILTEDEVPEGFTEWEDEIYQNDERGGEFTVNDPNSSNQYHFNNWEDAMSKLIALKNPNTLPPPPPPPPLPNAVKNSNTTAGIGFSILPYLLGPTPTGQIVTQNSNVWYGNNGKRYNRNWGGNQYTGGRSQSAANNSARHQRKISKYLNKVAKSSIYTWQSL